MSHSLVAVAQRLLAEDIVNIHFDFDAGKGPRIEGKGAGRTGTCASAPVLLCCRYVEARWTAKDVLLAIGSVSGSTEHGNSARCLFVSEKA
jgi:hypothetical protein